MGDGSSADVNLRENEFYATRFELVLKPRLFRFLQTCLIS